MRQSGAAGAAVSQAAADPTDVTAVRIGDRVVVHWTTPAQTTDKLDIVDPGHSVTAQLCWEETAIATPSSVLPGVRQARAVCHPTISLAARPGASEAVDTLSPALATGPLRVLGYRVELRNLSRRSAGLSAAAPVAGGAALPLVDGLRATAGRNGATLQWAPASGTPPETGVQFVELTRIQTGSPETMLPAASKTPSARSPRSAAQPELLPGKGKIEPKEAHLRVPVPVGEATGQPGTIDRTARAGFTYTYAAQRVLTVTLAGQQVEQRSDPSPAVTVAMLDIFPPAPAAGLAASPGFTSEAQPRPTIDLSWQPSIDTRIAGYLVYRVPGGQPPTVAAAHRLTPSPVATVAFRDLTVAPGSAYTYIVTTVDTAGNESSPSTPVTETAPTL